jgi:hypothetical protein
VRRREEGRVRKVQKKEEDVGVEVQEGGGGQNKRRVLEKEEEGRENGPGGIF